MYELDSKYITIDDWNNYSQLKNDMNKLADNNYPEAYRIHLEALGQYDRWSEILFIIRIGETKGMPKNPALKDRVAQILKSIDNVYVSSRMVWGKAKDDITGGKY